MSEQRRGPGARILVGPAIVLAFFCCTGKLNHVIEQIPIEAAMWTGAVLGVLWFVVKLLAAKK